MPKSAVAPPTNNHSFSINNSMLQTGEKPQMTSPTSNITSNTKPSHYVNDTVNEKYRQDYVKAATQLEEYKGTIKGLKSQIKSLKGENLALR